ncbi:MAG TPA: SMP-30/gluconolactonase/LRE family protein [Ilumatobacteraceae bacterium]
MPVETLITGLAMGESARWRAGRFWCSDWVAGEILAIDLDGTSAVVTRSTSSPFCFDWRADGTMLVTGGTGLERLDVSSGELVPEADLTPLGVVGGWNEVIVAPSGVAYVNAINFDMHARGMDFDLGSRRGVIAVVTPDGEARIVADKVAFPNGMAITPDGSTLICAESFAARLGAWDIEPDGSLTNRRVWAEVPDGADGISIDADGAVWCATQKGCARVREGGRVTDVVPLDLFGFSCVLGGPDGRTLFVVANEWHGPENIGKGPRTGCVFTTQVDVPAAR